jgi:hypothetical protein
MYIGGLFWTDDEVTCVVVLLIISATIDSEAAVCAVA